MFGLTIMGLDHQQEFLEWGHSLIFATASLEIKRVHLQKVTELEYSNKTVTKMESIIFLARG